MKSNPGPAGVEIGQIPDGLPAGLATAGFFHSGVNTPSMSEKVNTPSMSEKGGGVAAGLALGPAVAVGFGVAGALEQAPTVATKPAPPASRSSRRRLTSSGRPSRRSGGGASMALRISIA